MRKKIEWKWEKLDDNAYRIKVFGGWLIGYYDLCRDGGKSSFSRIIPSVFIGDKDHEWHVVLREEEKPPAVEESIAKDFEASA